MATRLVRNLRLAAEEFLAYFSQAGAGAVQAANVQECLICARNLVTALNQEFERINSRKKVGLSVRQ